MKLVVGSRASTLAMVQAKIVVEQLLAREASLELTIRPIRTEGDRRGTAPLSEIGGAGVFVKELEVALQRRQIDLAVHSLKDVPAMIQPDLQLTAILRRDDPRDVLITRGGGGLASLPSGAIVGTGSSRREVHLHALRPDLVMRPIRGNVDTRLKKLDEGQYDALVLAAAGLQRLGRLDRVAQFFESAAMVPAVGQGALAIETRRDEPALQKLVSQLDDADTHASVTAERSFLSRLGAGCRLPVGAYAHRDGDELSIIGMIGRTDGTFVTMTLRAALAEAATVGERLADQLSDIAQALAPAEQRHA